MLFTKDFFNLVIDFGDLWVITHVATDFKAERIYLEIEYKSSTYEDPETLEQMRLYDHSPVREWRHLDTMQYKTYIRCKIPRVKDAKGKVKRIKPPWANKHDRHTYLFEIAVIDLLQATKNQTKTAQYMKCSFRLVNRILHISTERGMKRRGFEGLTFDHLSIDEKSFKKGHKYVTVLSHPRSGAVLDVEENRDTKSAKRLIDNTLTVDQQMKVSTISMDMWKPYINTAKDKLLNAKIVHDKFHLIAEINKMIDKIRRREVKIHDELKNSRYALLKNNSNLTITQREKFDIISKSNLDVAKAMHVRENFKSLFKDYENTSETKAIFIQWAHDSFMKNIKEVKRIVMMFLNHSSGVINALATSFNNAMAERLNGKIQHVKTTGRGYRTFNNFRSAILFFHGKLSLYPLIW